MKPRILKASFFYKEYLDWFYLQHPAIRFASFDVHSSVLMSDAFAWADFWKLQLEGSGQFDVTEIVVNAEDLQKRWALEAGCPYGLHWALDILMAQILEYKPDVFFAQDYTFIDGRFIANLRRLLPSLILIGYDGIGLNDPKRFADYDLMLVLLDASKHVYLTNGIQSMQIKAGFFPAVLDRLGETARRGSPTFLGSVSMFQGGHYSRIRLLKYLSDRTNLDLFLAGAENFSLASKAAMKRIMTGRSREVGDLLALKKKARGPVFGLQMYQILASSPVTLNVHIDRAGGQAANMRLFEATGVGACLLTDWKGNLDSLFNVDEEIVVYRSKEECLEKIRYLIENPEYASSIGLAGQKRTLLSHSLSSVIEDVSKTVLEML